MKSLWKAMLMAIVLFAYGYFLSTAGHDHASHQQGIKEHQEMEEGMAHDQHDHDHK